MLRGDCCYDYCHIKRIRMPVSITKCLSVVLFLLFAGCSSPKWFRTMYLLTNLALQLWHVVKGQVAVGVGSLSILLSVLDMYYSDLTKQQRGMQFSLPSFLLSSFHTTLFIALLREMALYEGSKHVKLRESGLSITHL